ncbi:hypothetical protein [Synechococcus sp. MU1611]|uniref:hypothetical protein n=1 Tax=Synechococcus sp. MU1611 TaxID=2508345 RepID=UPI001CF8B3A4|nr:hypothetical protein [Synechococcus sp. MU1611]
MNTGYTVVSKIPLPAGTSGTKFIVTSDTSTEKLVQLSSSACGSRWCKLMIWDNAEAAGRGFPLSDSALASLVASYVHNPNTNYEQLIVRGKEVPMGQCTNLRP